MKGLSWKICVLLQRRCNFEVFLSRVVWGFARAFFLFCLRALAEVSDFLGVSRMLLEHEGDYGLGMDVKVTVCSWSTKEIMVWAWM